MKAKDTTANEDGAADDAWKAAFEKSLLENYGVKPDHYEELENGVYQVYVEIDGKVVPYVREMYPAERVLCVIGILASNLQHSLQAAWWRAP